MLYYYPYRFNLQWYCYETRFIDRQDLSDQPRWGGFARFDNTPSGRVPSA
jgi:hypothetical protein